MQFGLRELIFILVLLAVPVSSYWFVFRPQNAEIDEAMQEIEHKELMLQSLAAATAKTADLAKANEEIGHAIAMIESRLPTNKEVDVILEQVSDIATGGKLELARVRSEKPVPSATYMEQPLQMRIRGEFAGFYSFLLELEKLDRITRMPSFRVIRADKSDGVIEANFTLSIYFESEDASGEKS